MPQSPLSQQSPSRASLQALNGFSASDLDEAAIVDSDPRQRSRSNVRRTVRSGSFSSALSSSLGPRQPTRSFFHHASHPNTEHVQYSSGGVRLQTQQLASWALGESPRSRSDALAASDSRADSDNEGGRRYSWTFSDSDGRNSLDLSRPGVIPERSEPVSPEENENGADIVTTGNHGSTTSALSNLFSSKKQPIPQTYFSTRAKNTRNDQDVPEIQVQDEEEDATEHTALLGSTRSHTSQRKSVDYLERQSTTSKGRLGRWKSSILWNLESIRHPESWDVPGMIHASTGAMSAVFLGVLLNVLDALSYGMILFPLGEAVFEKTGPDGISMFYVSCIVSQLTYSLGGTAFKGGVGSEMIEVVPFFHKMAYMILGQIGADDPEAVLATTITSYAISSILTGIIFLLLGALRLGNLVSFFPRSILLGCIGGVGVFLFLTGIEVSAGLDSSMDWGPDTLKRLITPSTFVLWIIPLVLSLSLMVIRHFATHPIVLPAFFIVIVGIFYVVFAALPSVSMDDLRQSGWVFRAPEAGVPFYNFYNYYKFSKVNWTSLIDTVPTMFALSFFGIIHVPINVPALGIAVQQDDVNINRELFGHGISNALSGFVGSIQNYLVFANSRLFINNGGNNRAAGVLLAIATGGVWIAGPAMIGYIPILIVGTLIFMLGIEMVQEALWDTFGRIHKLEYLMVLAITLVMGFHDFVVGIMLGIVLACLNFVVQNSRISAVKAIYSGAVAESTVRRHPLHRRFLHAVGSQIKLTKLSGYLFFGSIVAVEKKIKALIEEEAFLRQPIRYLIVDFAQVQGLDFSAAEAFVRMNRVLRNRAVEMVLSGVADGSEISMSLSMVGLLEENEDEDYEPPRVFQDLNQALEACENELLIALKSRSEQLASQKKDATSRETLSMAIPSFPQPQQNLLNPAVADSTMQNSPRSNQLTTAAATTLSESDISFPSKYQSFAQPLPLILQAFKDFTSRDLDFWHRALPYFQYRNYPANTILFRRGDEPTAFWLLEDGIVRADHVSEQGSYAERIVAGTTCGELPFLSGTKRTATATTETEVTAWTLEQEAWDRLWKEDAEVATEILRVGLKLAHERMNSITSYVLVMAS